MPDPTSRRHARACARVLTEAVRVLPGGTSAASRHCKLPFLRRYMRGELQPPYWLLGRIAAAVESAGRMTPTLDQALDYAGAVDIAFRARAVIGTHRAHTFAIANMGLARLRRLGFADVAGRALAQ